MLEIGVQNDSVASTIDNIALMPSGYVGVNTRTPQVMLDVNGDINCTEIKVNSIPINAFTNYIMGAYYALGTNWGRGNIITRQSSPSPSYSHSSQFSETSSGIFYCTQLGTYEITANVIFRNTSSARENPFIGISINDDTNDTTGTNITPNWNLIPYNQTPFAVSYVRMGEGKVCSLTAKRTHHFTNTTDLVGVKTYLETATGDAFQDTQNIFTILNATIQFKYIGNFDSIA